MRYIYFLFHFIFFYNSITEVLIISILSNIYLTGKCQKTTFLSLLMFRVWVIWAKWDPIGCWKSGIIFDMGGAFYSNFPADFWLFCWYSVDVTKWLNNHVVTLLWYYIYMLPIGYTWMAAHSLHTLSTVPAVAVVLLLHIPACRCNLPVM